MATGRKPLTKKQRNILQQERSTKRTFLAAEASSTRLAQQRTAQAAIREQQHRETRAATQQDLIRQRRVANVQNAAATKVVQTATPSSDSNLVMTTIFVMFGLIIFYQLVTRTEATTSWLNGLSKWLHALSSNTPLFVSTAKG